MCVCVCVLNQTPFVENNSFQRPHTPILQPSSVAKNEIPRTCNAADFCLCTSSHCSHCLPPSLSGFANKREWPLVKSSFKWISFPSSRLFLLCFLFAALSSHLVICLQEELCQTSLIGSPHNLLRNVFSPLLLEEKEQNLLTKIFFGEPYKEIEFGCEVYFKFRVHHKLLAWICSRSKNSTFFTCVFGWKFIEPVLFLAQRTYEREKLKFKSSRSK